MSLPHIHFRYSRTPNGSIEEHEQESAPILGYVHIPMDGYNSTKEHDPGRLFAVVMWTRGHTLLVPCDVSVIVLPPEDR